MSESISSIYNELTKDGRRESTATFDFLEQHVSFLSSRTEFASADELRLYIELTSIYVGTLHQLGLLDDAIAYSRMFKSIIDNAITGNDADALKDKWYFDLDFVLGMSLYKRDKFGEAKAIFENLVRANPSHKVYSNWLAGAKHYHKIRMLKFISTSCFIFLVLFYNLKHFIPYYYYSPLYRLFPFTLGSITFVYVLYLQMKGIPNKQV